MLNVRDVHYRYGSAVILRGIDLDLAPGEVVSLVGPNGAGKSTLLKCIIGILQPSQGAIWFDGRQTREVGRLELARQLTYVPQHAGPASMLAVVDMIALGRAPHRGAATSGRDREVVASVVERLHLEPIAFRLFGTLSGGERQRVLIARALAQQGSVMVLDEPTAALDLRHQLETMTIVRSIVRERGIAALIAIHDLALAGRFSDRLVLLAEGRVHAAGVRDEVLTAPNIERVYGVGAVLGTDRGLPYVIPYVLPTDRVEPRREQ